MPVPQQPLPQLANPPPTTTTTHTHTHTHTHTIDTTTTIQLAALEDPNHRSDAELRDIRAFREAALQLGQRPDARTTYDLRLACFYMWAQSDAAVYIACRVPTGYADRELVVEASGGGLLVQAECSPPLVDRLLEGALDPSRPIETYRTEDNRVCVAVLPKAAPGERWRRLFRGDPDGARCLEPPYAIMGEGGAGSPCPRQCREQVSSSVWTETLTCLHTACRPRTETDEDVVLEFSLPFWIEPADICVDIGERQLEVTVRGQLDLLRTYWRNTAEEARRRDYVVVDAAQSSWSLDEDVDVVGERCKVRQCPEPPGTLQRGEPC